MEWISVEDRLPEFGSQVFAWCPLYGRGVRRYLQIEDTGFGNWTDAITDEIGGLPPKYWMQITLPEPPKDSQ